MLSPDGKRQNYTQSAKILQPQKSEASRTEAFVPELDLALALVHGNLGHKVQQHSLRPHEYPSTQDRTANSHPTAPPRRLNGILRCQFA